MSKKSYLSLLTEAITDFNKLSANIKKHTGPMIDPILNYSGSGELDTHKEAGNILKRFYFSENKPEEINVLDEVDNTEDEISIKDSIESILEGDEDESMAKKFEDVMNSISEGDETDSVTDIEKEVILNIMREMEEDEVKDEDDEKEDKEDEDEKLDVDKELEEWISTLKEQDEEKEEVTDEEEEDEDEVDDTEDEVDKEIKEWLENIDNEEDKDLNEDKPNPWVEKENEEDGLKEAVLSLFGEDVE